MQSFLNKVSKETLAKYSDVSQLTFILPSKRAGLFLKTEIKILLRKTSILPKILSIEDFIQVLSGLNQIDSITLIFEFYKIYIELTPPDEQDNFEIFSKWATLLLQDFNEIDSNLFDAKKLLDYIKESRRLENWNLEENQTSLTLKYLGFFNHIETYYSKLQKHLLNKNSGYQGMLYQKALENTRQYIKNSNVEQFIFVGFNALNIAEEKIIHKFLFQKKAKIFWDNDTFYSENNIQADTYFEQYKNKWTYFKTHKFQWKADNINTTKNVQIHGVTKNISQIKKASNILEKLAKENKIENTAVILGNEKLLPVLLNSLPKEIQHANITMGYELQNMPLSVLFDYIFKLHLHKQNFEKKNTYYYKDFLRIVQHSGISNLFNNNSEFNRKINKLLYNDKAIFIDTKEIIELIKPEDQLFDVFSLIFNQWDNNVNNNIETFISLIQILSKAKLLNTMDKEYLFHFSNVFQQLLNLNIEYGFINNLNTLNLIYKQILKTESLSFQGEPLKGLQIMGLLESRVLDFENVIITSVNEGFIPSGNTQNSFIPFDIKIEKGLPTYIEKDAIFSYHFFRLFHRAKNIYLIYNTETDDFGSGEQSRFITQLEIAKQNGNIENVRIERKNVIPKLNSVPLQLKEIPKTNQVIDRLNELAAEGFSPSSLSLYIRNPVDFYKRKVLKLKEFKEVEENVAANTFGTIVHDTLEQLYKPYIEKYITVDSIKEMKREINDVVTKHFKNQYSLNSIVSGKNYLTFEIAKQFILNFLNFEISELTKGKKIMILALEKDLEHNFSLNSPPYSIKLKGKVDRIDLVDGVLRIIDYKTGKVELSDLKIKDWSSLTSEESYSKSFQVLTYAYMFYQDKGENFDFEEQKMESGIISFKNLKNGFMKVNNSFITLKTIDNFLEQFNYLFLELYNKEIPFIEKDITRKQY